MDSFDEHDKLLEQTVMYLFFAIKLNESDDFKVEVFICEIFKHGLVFDLNKPMLF